MSSTNDQSTVDDGTLIDEPPDQQLAGIISAELISRQFTTEAKRDSVARKIATGQMNAEDWRIMAASSLQTDIQAAEERGVQS